MLIAWTTLATPEQAQSLAADAVAAGLASCVQVEGPITSHYLWEGFPRQTMEYRLCFKFGESQGQALETFVHKHHPYSVPEWVVVRTEHVSQKYLSWTGTLRTSVTL